MRINAQRRAGKADFRPPVFPDRRWDWLSDMEPYANIALRSVHMLEFAVETAIQRGEKRVSLFVGEVHNTDIAGAASTAVSLEEEVVLTPVRLQARELAQCTQRRLRLRMVKYEVAFAVGLALPPPLYYLAIKGLWSLFT